MNQDPQHPVDLPAISTDGTNTDESQHEDSAAGGAGIPSSENPHVQAAAAATAVQGRRVTFSLPSRRQQGSGRRVFRIHTNDGAQVTIRHRGNGVVRMHRHHQVPPPMTSRNTSRMIPVEDLVPVLLHENQQTKHREPGPPQLLAATTTAQNAGEVELQFECVICYDTLIDPVGCGNCTSRFCRPCLQTALHQHRQCPVCRSDRSEIVADNELQQCLGNYGVVCQYCFPETFDGALYPIGVHRIPHVDCPDLKVACRLAPYGCQWSGSRRDINHNCAYEQITGLLEQFRQHEIRSEDMIRRMASTVQPPPPPMYAVFPHLLQFAVLLCTQPTQLKPESWASFVDVRQNFEAAMMCLPTALLQIKLFTRGLLQLLETIENWDENADGRLLDSWIWIWHAVCGFATFAFTLGVWPSHHRGWRHIRLFGMLKISDVHISVMLGVQAYLSQDAALNTTKSTARTSLISAALMVSTLFVPLSMSIAANRIICARNLTTANRSKAVDPLRASIVCSLVCTMSQFNPLLDGLLLCYGVVAPLVKRYGVGSGNDKVLEFMMTGIRREGVALALISRSAWASRGKSSLAVITEGCCAAALWIGVYICVLQLERFGEKAAALILRHREPFGLAVFGCWILSLYILVIV